MNEVQISRDPFSRISLMRRLSDNACKCAWCGRTRVRIYKNVEMVQFAFEYGTQRDDRGSTHWDGKAFCSISCRRSYFGD